MRDWNQFFTAKEIDEMLHDNINEHGFTKLLNAKIREAIEAAPRLYGQKENLCDGLFAWQFSEIGVDSDTHVGTLIDMKPIEKGEA